MSLKINRNSVIHFLFIIYSILVMCFANNMRVRILSIGILFVMLVLTFLKIQRLNRSIFFQSPKLYYLFVLYALSSFLWAVSRERSEAVLYELGTSVLIVFIIDRCIYTEYDLIKFCKEFIFAIVATNVYLIVCCGFNISLIRENISTIIGLDKNYFSQICAIAIILCFVLSRQNHKLIYYVSIIFCLLCIIGSGSRKALLFIGIEFFAFFMYLYRRNLTKQIKYISICIVALVVALIILQRYNNEFFVKIINGIAVFFMSDSDVRDASATIRIALIGRGMSLFFTHPILGVGLNNFSHFANDINTAWGVNYGGYIYAHNNYVELLADFGLLGFLIYSLIYISYFVELKKSNFKQNNNYYVAVSFTIILVLLLNDIASVSYYLKFYQILMLFAYKFIATSKSKNLSV